jgi:opacity protein-like surface antigen
MKCSRLAFLSFAVAIVSASAAHAQVDVSGSFYEAFTNGTAGNGTKQTPSNADGGMVEARYLMKPLLGLGMSYSYNHANQSFAPNGSDCEYACANPVTNLSAFADEISLDYVPSVKIGKVRPFAVGGVGFFITSPGKSAYEVSTVVRPVYVVGGGLDFTLISHFGVRIQYRDNLYKAPDLSALYPATGVFTSSSEPMGGLFYRF